MNAVALGPLVFSAERFTAIAALAVFVLLSELLARRVHPRLSTWAWLSVLVFVLAARFGHVLEYMDTFSAQPWRALALWQGGFKVSNGIVAMIVFTFVYLRRHGNLLRWTVPPAAAGLVTAVALILWTGGVPPAVLPEEQFQTLDGQGLIPASLVGQPVVVNLWATWCGPCRREMPMMADVARDNSDTVFLFVNQREDAARIATYLATEGINLPNVVLDRHGRFGRHYSSIGLPATLFVGRDGVLRGVHVGEISQELLLSRMAALE
ncbi:MAG: TlpA disulfide reductase family protein [Paracoccus sp. (in: a-proteobacteria)]|uniref:TlpA disulfide reductase family protein n=1 Tax=Paracoccus sp. TaxID=267 RepID=UPI0026DEA7F3|nr:TlpA disulfide reductase family protein [Paracoccus sp. (in: a-proteobacteria)]MDO5612138.1 TlpA disulfide reductase family protein [Paracoccus sp. (in: a-proteobacteria)]